MTLQRAKAAMAVIGEAVLDRLAGTSPLNCVPADLDPAGPRPGVVDDGLATTAPTPGHFQLPWLPEQQGEFVSVMLTDGTMRTERVGTRSDFRGCNCDASRAADLEDHQPRCAAHKWARTYRILSEFLAAADVFPTRDLQDAAATRLTNSIHQT